MKWHINVPIAYHFSLNVKEGPNNVDSLSLLGDYILSVTEQSPWGCKWEMSITHCIYYQNISLVVKPSQDAGFLFHLFLEGVEPGPEWIRNDAHDLNSIVDLSLVNEILNDPERRSNWPELLTVTPLRIPPPGKGHLLVPAST